MFTPTQLTVVQALCRCYYARYAILRNVGVLLFNWCICCKWSIAMEVVRLLNGWQYKWLYAMVKLLL